MSEEGVAMEGAESILRAVRRLLRTGEASSVLERAIRVMRRYDAMRAELGKSYPDEQGEA